MLRKNPEFTLQLLRKVGRFKGAHFSCIEMDKVCLQNIGRQDHIVLYVMLCVCLCIFLSFRERGKFLVKWDGVGEE